MNVRSYEYNIKLLILFLICIIGGTVERILFLIFNFIENMYIIFLCVKLGIFTSFKSVEIFLKLACGI